MAASRGLRLLALAALARGEPAVGDGQAGCRSTLAGLRARAKFEVAALCRASLPTGICKQAMQELGPAPWSSESIHSACSRWDSEWAPAMQMKGRSLESVVLDSVTETKAPTPVPTPSVPTPWQTPSPGSNQDSLLIESLDARSASDDEEQAKKIKNATADLAENVTNATAAKVDKAKEQQAKSIKNATAELPDNVTDATTVKVGKAKDKLKDAAKRFKHLLRKKRAPPKTGKAEEVLDDAEVQGGSVAKDGLQSTTASWASALLAAAAVCSMAVLAAGKLWRRRAVSQRTVASRGRSSLYDADDVEGLE